MELQALANGEISVLPGDGTAAVRPTSMGKRVKDAHGKARDYLKTSALLTDVYFHFTPSQIMLACLSLADPELTDWYIAQKFPLNDDMAQAAGKKILSAIGKCAHMLKEVDPSSEPSATERKELQALAKKLKKCRNPEKIDLLSLQKAKREGDVIDEKVIKKRKLEREQSAKEGEDLFGPDLKKA